MDEPTDEFTASNGYRIVNQGTSDPIGWLAIHNRNPDPSVSKQHSLGLYSIEALREFFEWERSHER